jgi:hypothetical protein
MIFKDEHDKGLSLSHPEICISNTSLVSHLNDPIHKKMSSPQNVHLRFRVASEGARKPYVRYMIDLHRNFSRGSVS